MITWAGSAVSLNVSDDTRATSNSKTNLKIGSTLPFSNMSTLSITVVDPVLTIKTAFTDQLFVSTDSTVDKLVAGMYDVRFITLILMLILKCQT